MNNHSMRRWLVGAATATVVVASVGCATVNAISSDVSSFGEWPVGRAMTTYAFERLPSQEARPDDQAMLESAARGAIERAGFKPTEAARADVLVQVAVRASRQDRGWDDRNYYWPRVSVWGGRGVYWGLHTPYPTTPRVDREVAVLLRDRASGKTLYETRAVNSGFSSVDTPLLAAMFEAALKDFPRPAVSPRRVDTVLPSADAMPTAGPTPEQQKIVR